MDATAPQGAEKNFKRNIQGKCVSAPHRTRSAPQPEQESILGHFLLGGFDFEVYLDHILRATTIKRSSTFLTKKVRLGQNPGYAYDTTLSGRSLPAIFRLQRKQVSAGDSFCAVLMIRS